MSKRIFQTPFPNTHRLTKRKVDFKKLKITKKADLAAKLREEEGGE